VTRPHEQRETQNASCHGRRVGAGVETMTALGPAEHISELPRVLLEWHRYAKPQLLE
jgi:hypothetical protein